jgi:hypothetical protein
VISRVRDAGRSAVPIAPRERAGETRGLSLLIAIGARFTNCIASFIRCFNALACPKRSNPLSQASVEDKVHKLRMIRNTIYNYSDRARSSAPRESAFLLNDGGADLFSFSRSTGGRRAAVLCRMAVVPAILRSKAAIWVVGALDGLYGSVWRRHALGVVEQCSHKPGRPQPPLTVSITQPC